ncbi:MAG: hypothetical protein SVE93_04460 [Candidatus Thermoplasmatota archaeon]|nr:hypothetical protein [Candidatus Thermoplasmatota archaeon]
MDDIDFLMDILDDEEEKKIIKALSKIDYNDKRQFEKVLDELLEGEDDDRI